MAEQDAVSSAGRSSGPSTSRYATTKAQSDGVRIRYRRVGLEGVARSRTVIDAFQEGTATLSLILRNWFQDDNRCHRLVALHEVKIAARPANTNSEGRCWIWDFEDPYPQTTPLQLDSRVILVYHFVDVITAVRWFTTSPASGRILICCFVL